MFLTLACGCPATVPTPPLAGHEADVPETVPYPPPPARVELLPPRPSDEATWVDGEWLWTESGWAWRPGSWEHPRPGARWAPPLSVRLPHGELVHYRGRWHK